MLVVDAVDSGFLATQAGFVVSVQVAQDLKEKHVKSAGEVSSTLVRDTARHKFFRDEKCFDLVQTTADHETRQ